ncbi:MAG: acyltransferase family protein [Pseudomonadota bacterium]
MRYHYMDSARAIFMILGVFYHTALIYTTSEVWLVAGEELNVFFDYFSYVMHLFRMQGFYIVAGFFAAMLIEKKGAKNFLHERLIRLGIPMLMIGFTLNYYMNEWSTAMPVLTTGWTYFLNGDWVGHLWFLGNLIVYIAITTIFILKKKNTVTAVFEFFAQTSKKYFILKFMLFSFFFYLVGHMITVNLADKIFFVEIPALFKYFPFYVLGYLFYFNRQILEDVVNYQKLKYHIFLSIAILLVMSKMLIFYNEGFFIKLFSLVLEIYLSIILSLSIILAFKSIKLFNNSSKTVRKLSDSSYTIYLLHQPFIVGFFHVFNEQIRNPVLGFMVISLSTAIFAYFLHVYFIQRYQIASLLLNGSYLKT